MPRLIGSCTILLAMLAFVGCTKAIEEPPAALASPAAVAKLPEKTVVAQPVSRPRLQKSFKAAVTFDPPLGQQCPPARTFAGKNVAQIFEAIAGPNYAGGLWDQIEYVDARGRRLNYRAIVKTDLGDIHIDLLADAAPQHVTNFIALARAGYYDGLPFHASRRVVTEQERLGYLEAGCPKGTGDKGYGSVGYWLEPETDNALIHEAGTVGAFHEPDQESTAACRFYIALHPMPGLDREYTIFGKVSRGLDVADRINQRPVINEDPYDRPREPAIIHKVLIESVPQG